MFKVKQDGKGKQNQNQNQNQQKQQNSSSKTQQHQVSSEDFNLKETKPSIGGGRLLSGYDRVGSAFDLVEQMQYLYIRIVKAKYLTTNDENDSPDPFVEVQLGSYRGVSRHFEDNYNPEWNQVFALLKERIHAPVFQVLVRKDRSGDDLIGMLVFDIGEVPRRVPPDSPLAPQWYKLEDRRGEKVRGELMLAIWMGTQADEAFPDSWHLDASSVNGDGVMNIRSKVYLSPRLWYLRINVIEAQELVLMNKNRLQPELSVKAVLGIFDLRTKICPLKNLSPSWNEDLMFAVAEPFEGRLVLSVEDKLGNKEDVVGQCEVSLQGVDKRIDSMPPAGRWYNLEKHTYNNGEHKVMKLNSRIHVRISLDGGYHVLDELTQYSSDLRPTAKELWKPPIGVLELGILNAQGLSSMKNVNGSGTTDAYCVAKYGQKWIRTRTVLNSFNPKWNEQYTWEVYDPCTVITIAVFDNCHLKGLNREGGQNDAIIGKVRIRLSTLATNRVYSHSYPLIALTPSGVKKMGEIQLAVKFSCSTFMDMLQMYIQPLLPILHYTQPLTATQIDILRHQATHIVVAKLGRAEPPLRRETVEYMLDVGSNMWSVRRAKANHSRIAAVVINLADLFMWFNGICTWKKPVTTIVVHIMFMLLVCFPWKIMRFTFLIVFIIGIYNYPGRPRHPAHMDVKLSRADTANTDELDEEFDTFPTTRPADTVKMRYDRLRAIASRLQVVAGDLASQGERIHNLLSWRDPRATGLFLVFCLVAFIVLFRTPPKAFIISIGFYAMRHPRVRNNLPSPPISFFRRLPARADSLL
ncbi:hypothetical protein Leryth_019558 [Lithospermum erythrorhizon]|nr:hypothetical protein Leryth_019558 [Lithospermum erythrorhizon]